VEKAQAIRLEACIPQNWWEFAVNYAVHVYNQTSLKRSSNNYITLFERLHRTKPDVAHLRVFGCGAYVFLPEDMQSNNLSPRSKLMTFIRLSEGTMGYIFMRSPNNNVFTAIQALFNETLFPKCPTMCITTFSFDFTFTLLFFIFDYLIPLNPGHESSYL
jgi:hypothetical protein